MELERAYSDINIVAIRRLIDTAQESGIPNVYGMLVDCVQFPEEINVYLDEIIKSKFWGPERTSALRGIERICYYGAQIAGHMSRPFKGGQ